MRADSWFRRHCLFAFALPFFRLRQVFAPPSDRLRDRSGNALGLSNLRSDSPLDSIRFYVCWTLVFGLHWSFEWL
jgi:hypothetical protein